MARFHVGVDVGRTQHVARVLDTTSGHLNRSFGIPISQEGFDAFQRYLEGFSSNPEDFFLAVEATGAYHIPLASYLWHHRYTLALVNPARSKAFRKAQGHTAKTDRIDAGVLCHMISGVGLRATEPRPAAQERLRTLTRWYFRLQEERTRAINRVSATVDMIFPEFWQVFSDLTHVTPRAVLQAYSTPDEISRADKKELNNLIHRASLGHRSPKDGEHLKALALRTVGVRDIYEPAALQIRQALTQIAVIERQEKDLVPYIEREFRALGFSAEEFPIGDVTTLATLVAHLPSPQTTPSVQALHAYVGWCPADHQSGQYRSAHPRMGRGCPQLRWALYGLTLAALSHVDRYKQYAEQRRSQGKAGGHILIIVGRKLLDRIWAIANEKPAFTVPVSVCYKLNKSNTLIRPLVEVS